MEIYCKMTNCQFNSEKHCACKEVRIVVEKDGAASVLCPEGE
jgi:hypothetical protein